jgi:hypothetical protein
LFYSGPTEEGSAWRTPLLPQVCLAPLKFLISSVTLDTGSQAKPTLRTSMGQKRLTKYDSLTKVWNELDVHEGMYLWRVP